MYWKEFIQMQNPGLSAQAIANRYGMQKSTVQKFTGGLFQGKIPNGVSLARIAAGEGMKPWQLLRVLEEWDGIHKYTA